jgi:hypothetical protein
MDDPWHWRDRAREARSQADEITDLGARLQMLEVAAGYDLLAERAEQRLRDQKSA